MATDKRQFTMRMTESNFDKIRIVAAYNKRSIAMQIEHIIEQAIHDHEAKHGEIMVREDDDQ